MEYYLIPICVLSCLTCIFVGLYCNQLLNRYAALRTEKDLAIAQLNDYLAKLRNERDSYREKYHKSEDEKRALEAIKRNPTKDCLEMLNDIKAGGSIVRIEVLNPDNMFLWSPGDNR